MSLAHLCSPFAPSQVSKLKLERREENALYYSEGDGHRCPGGGPGLHRVVRDHSSIPGHFVNICHIFYHFDS